MRRHGLLVTLLTAGWVASAYTQEPPPQPTGLEALSWMLGDWAFTDGQSTTGESWQRAGASTWEGYGFMVREGDTTRTEDLRLLAMQGEVFYLSKVDHNALPVAFRMVAGNDSSCVFENTSHDFPQRIIYRKTESGLTARIEGVSGGKDRSADYPYLRVSRQPGFRQGVD